VQLYPSDFAAPAAHDLQGLKKLKRKATKVVKAPVKAAAKVVKAPVKAAAKVVKAPVKAAAKVVTSVAKNPLKLVAPVGKGVLYKPARSLFKPPTRKPLPTPAIAAAAGAGAGAAADALPDLTLPGGIDFTTAQPTGFMPEAAPAPWYPSKPLPFTPPPAAPLAPVMNFAPPAPVAPPVPVAADVLPLAPLAPEPDAPARGGFSLDGEAIPGVPNKWLLGGGVLLVALVALRK